MEELKIIELLLSEDNGNKEVAMAICEGLNIDIENLSKKYNYSENLATNKKSGLYQRLRKETNPPILPYNMRLLEVIGKGWKWRNHFAPHIGKSKWMAFHHCKLTEKDFHLFNGIKYITFFRCKFSKEFLKSFHTLIFEMVEIVNCGLQEFPKVNENTRSLLLSFNNINEIPNNLPQKLVSLRVDNNKIKTIAANTFDALTELEGVDLSNNLLTDLPIIKFSDWISAVDNLFPYDQNGMWKPDWLDYPIESMNYEFADMQFQKTKK